MESLESSRLCRLCGKYTPNLAFDIFDEKENNAQKINRILPISVHELDFLPKYMCYVCNYKLTEFHDFYNQCLQADEELKSQLSWMPPKDSAELCSMGKERSPMVAIGIRNLKDIPDFDVNALPDDVMQEKNEKSLGKSLIPDFNNLSHSWSINYDQSDANFNSNNVSKRFGNEKSYRSKRCSSTLSDRKLRSNKSESSPHGVSKTARSSPVARAKLPGAWDAKLFSDVEVKLEKVKVANTKIRKPMHCKDPGILQKFAFEKFDGNYNWKECKRKHV